jgi:hypothetical protein
VALAKDQKEADGYVKEFEKELGLSNSARTSVFSLWSLFMIFSWVGAYELRHSDFGNRLDRTVESGFQYPTDRMGFA